MCLGRVLMDVGSSRKVSVRWTWKAEMAAGSQRAASFPYKKVPSWEKSIQLDSREDTKPKCPFSYYAQAGQLRGVAKVGFSCEHQWQTSQTKESIKAYNWARDFCSVVGNQIFTNSTIILLLTSQFACLLVADALTILCKGLLLLPSAVSQVH